MIMNNQAYDDVGNDPLGRGPKKVPPPPPKDDTSFRPEFMGVDRAGGPMFPDVTFDSDKHPSGRFETAQLGDAPRQQQIQMQQQQAPLPPQHQHPPMTSRSSSSPPGKAYPIPQSTRSMPAMPRGYNDLADAIPPSPMQIYMSSSNANSSGTRRDQSTHYSMRSSHRSNNSENTRGEIGARPPSPNESYNRDPYVRDMNKQDRPLPHLSSSQQQPYYQRQQPLSPPERDSYYQQDRRRLYTQDASFTRPYPYDERQEDPQPPVYNPRRNPYQNHLNEQQHGLSYRGHNSLHHSSYTTHNNNSNGNSREERDMPPRSYGLAHVHTDVQHNSQDPASRHTPSRQAYDGSGARDEGRNYEQPIRQEYAHPPAQRYRDSPQYRSHSDGRDDDRRFFRSEGEVAHHNDGYNRNHRPVTQSKQYDMDRLCCGDDGYIDEQKDRREQKYRRSDKKNGWPHGDYREHDSRPRHDDKRSPIGYNRMERYDDRRNSNDRYPLDNGRPSDSGEPRSYDERRYNNRHHRDESRPRSGDRTPPQYHDGGPLHIEGPVPGGGGTYSQKSSQPLSPLSIPTCINGSVEDNRYDFSEVHSPQNTEAACPGSCAENRAPRRNYVAGGALKEEYGANPAPLEGYRNGGWYNMNGLYGHNTHSKGHRHDKSGRHNDRYDANCDAQNARQSHYNGDGDARDHIPRQVAVYQRNSKSSSGNDDRYNENNARPPRAPPPDRRDDYSGSSTIHTPSTFTLRQRQGSSERRQQASPPPPPANEYDNMHSRNDPRDNNLYSRNDRADRPHDDRRRHSSEGPRQSEDSRLSIEIPVTPQIHDGKDARSAPPQSSPDGSHGFAAQQHPSHGQDQRDQSQQPRLNPGSNPPRQPYPTGKSTPRIMHAEAERRQSNARHQIMKEIAQATNMRNSAMDEEDRKFWERQIATLNKSFRKL